MWRAARATREGRTRCAARECVSFERPRGLIRSHESGAKSRSVAPRCSMTRRTPRLVRCQMIEATIASARAAPARDGPLMKRLASRTPFSHCASPQRRRLRRPTGVVAPVHGPAPHTLPLIHACDRPIAMFAPVSRKTRRFDRHGDPGQTPRVCLDVRSVDCPAAAVFVKHRRRRGPSPGASSGRGAWLGACGGYTPGTARHTQSLRPSLRITRAAPSCQSDTASPCPGLRGHRAGLRHRATHAPARWSRLKNAAKGHTSPHCSRMPRPPVPVTPRRMDSAWR
jgi:hypothetical protein